ncbi:MAG: alpha/beta hydrolase [Acidimicrobiales bacterium]
MAAQRLTLTTSDDVELEAELHVPDGARAAVLLCHPHPLRGGSMSDGVPDALFRSLPARGVAALRFNFRGVGRSTGTHDEGRAEQHDVRAAIAALAAAAPGLALVVAGWSFGADVSLAVTDQAITGWSPIAPPLRIGGTEAFEAVAADPRPKLLLCPELDQFNPADKALQTVAGWQHADVVPVPGADHFLWGHEDFLTEAVDGFVTKIVTDRA